MQKPSLLFLLIICLNGFISAQDQYVQEEFEFPRSSDLGLNITSVLSSFLGNSSEEVDITSFPFMVKLNRGRNAFRFGMGFTFENSDETLVSVEQFIFNNYQLSSRVGWERKKYIGNKFGFFYGLDVLLHLANEENTVSNNVDVTNIIENTVGVGGGPVYGFEYYLNKYMYLGTEGTFYGLFLNTNSTQEFLFNPAINAQRTEQGFQAKITAPVRLYIMVRF